MRAPCAGEHGVQARQAYLTNFQALVRGNLGEIAMLLKYFGDAHVGEGLLQVVGTSDGELGQVHVHNPRGKVTKVSSKGLPLSRAGLRQVVNGTFVLSALDASHLPSPHRMRRGSLALGLWSENMHDL